MRRLIFAAALAASSLSMAACAATPGGVASAGATIADAAGAPAPSSFADKTVLDEKAATAVELAYRAARVAVELGVDAGLIKGQAAASVQTYNRAAWEAVQAVYSAYRAGNAESYREALTRALEASGRLLTLTGKGDTP